MSLSTAASSLRCCPQCCGDDGGQCQTGVIHHSVSTQPPVVLTGSQDTKPEEIKEVSQSAITAVSGKKVDIKTGVNLPSVITDAGLKAEVDQQIITSSIKVRKTSGGYILDASKDLSAIDTYLIIKS